MTLNVRRLIYIIFILIFLLAAPVILLYTAGYNYNFKRGNFLKTGVLMVDAKPTDAHFKIDNRLYNDSLPARISNLKPKDYNIEVERAGYWPWKKTLSLGSGETVFATNIFLPKKSDPQLLTEASISQAIFLEKGNQFILVTLKQNETQIILFDTLTRKTDILLDRLIDKNPKITISPNEKYLLVETPSETIVINLSRPGTTAKLQDKLGTLRNCAFEDDNDFVVYCLSGTTVARRNILTNEQEPIYSIGKSNFLVSGGFLYWTMNTPGVAFSLKRKPLLAGKEILPETLVHLPRGNYRLWNIDGLIAMHDQGTQIITLVNPDSGEIYTAGQLSGFNQPNNNSWLYWNPSEILINDLKNHTTALVTRIGQTIVKAVQLKKYPYVLYTAGDAISLIEEDNRNTKNIYTLATMDKIQNLFLLNDKIVYIVTANGLYTMTLQ